MGVAWALILRGGRLQEWLAVQGGAGSQLEPLAYWVGEGGHTTIQPPSLPAKPSAGTSVEICLASGSWPV